MADLVIYGIEDSIAYAEAIGLSKVFKAYAEKVGNEDIMEIGFNANSGYVYIALENGVSIVSMLGQNVEYLAYNNIDGEESYDTYDEAIEYLDDIDDEEY
jgi:hypothetical protein